MLLRLLFISINCFLASSIALAADSFCVQAKDASLKDQPESSSKKKVAQYMPLETTGKTKRNWIQVKDFAGKVSWVHRRDVSYAQKCVVVRVKKSKLFDGPGDDFANIATVKKGEAFLDLGEAEDGFIRVQNAAGEKSWIDVQNIWRPTENHLRMSFEKE